MPAKKQPEEQPSTPPRASPEPSTRQPKPGPAVVLPKEIRIGLSVLPELERPNPTTVELANLAAVLGPPLSGERALCLLWECAVLRYQTADAIKAITEKRDARLKEFRDLLRKQLGFDPYDYPNGISREKFLGLMMPGVPDKWINGKRIRTRDDVWLEFIRDCERDRRVPGSDHTERKSRRIRPGRESIRSGEKNRSNSIPSPEHILSLARLFDRWFSSYPSGRTQRKRKAKRSN